MLKERGEDKKQDGEALSTGWEAGKLALCLFEL